MFFKTLKDFVSKDNTLGFNDFIKQKDYFAMPESAWDYDFSGFKAYVDGLVSQNAASSRTEKKIGMKSCLSRFCPSITRAPGCVV